MNSCKISYDGRTTFWNARIASLRCPTASPPGITPEWRLFLSLPPEGKRLFWLSGMGLSHVTNLDASCESLPRARRGTKGITGYARSLVRMGAQALEDRHGLKQLSFLTLTLPESALTACTPLTWALVVNRFLKSLRRRLRRENLSTEIVGCTEVQEGRLEASGGRPPLHLHLLFQGRRRGESWCCRPVVFRALWAQACLSVWSDSRGFQSSSRVESLRSSGVSYLGKYMSKGGKMLELCNSDLLPSSWHTITRSLKNFVQKSEFRCSGELAKDLYYWLRDRDHLLWTKEVWSSQCADGSFFLMAWVGALSGRKVYWSIVQKMKKLLSSRSTDEILRFSSQFG